MTIADQQPDHHCLWSPLEDLPDGSVVYECIVDGCGLEVVFDVDGSAVPVEAGEVAG